MCIWKTGGQIVDELVSKIKCYSSCAYCLYNILFFFPGCTAGGLSFNSKTFTKMLQSCPCLCDRHKVILEAEERYKKELRKLAVCNNSRYATHESNNSFFFFFVVVFNCLKF